MNGDSVNFEELTLALQNHWRQISPHYPNIDDIEVIDIDLTLRSG